MTPETYRNLGQAVFEVVVPKLDNSDTFAYAEPLPRNLLPFSERNDPYFSIGTAFCIGKNRFISASHVFCLEEESLNTDFFIRDSEGKTYAVDKVYKYTNLQDCIVFSVANPPDIIPLENQEKPEINTRVFTVGNAFGQGIIVRDGVLTSMTPEDRSGAWKWLRFSAAASPGNSGGPLVDVNGKVLGITIAKSENENFNLALPITEAVGIPEGNAKLAKQLKYSIPILNYSTETIENTEVKLPLSISALREQLQNERAKLNANLLAQLLSEQRDKIFPEAKGSDFLLRNPMTSFLPGVACEQSDYSWKMSYPQNIQQVRLADESKLDYGDWNSYVFQHCSCATGDPSLPASLWRDPQKAMDNLLTGYSLTRTMANKNIRITSLGKPVSIEDGTDRYGRVWQLAQWHIAFADKAIIWLRLPTPDGYIGVLQISPLWDRQATINDLHEIINFMDADYMGTLDQWKAFLADEDASTNALRSFRFDYVQGKSLSISVPDFSMNMGAAHFAFSGATSLYCYFMWALDPSGALVQNVNSVYLRNNDDGEQGIGVARILKPGVTDSQDRRTAWKQIANGTAPFDKSPYKTDGSLYDYSRVELESYTAEKTNPENFNAAYLLELSAAGQTKTEEATNIFGSLVSAVRISPQAISSAMGIPMAKLDSTCFLKEINGMTIFEAIGTKDMATLKQFTAAKIDFDARNKIGRTPLHEALMDNCEEAALDLINSGANVDSTDNEKWTPLMYALRYSTPVICGALIEKGARLTGTNNNEWTHLIFAIRYSTPEIIQRMLDRGTNIDGTTNAGWTTLMFAFRYSTPQICDLLIDRGANRDGANEEGDSALMFAMANDKQAQAKRLIDAGADILKPNNNGWTPLMYALRYSTQEISSLLIEKNAQSSRKTNKGWSELLFALRYDKPQAAKQLIDKNADINAANDSGFSPLHMAARYASADLVRLLLEKGANPDAVTDEGKKPIDLAMEKKDPEILKLLGGSR